MKRLFFLLSIIVLLCAFGASSALAVKPVDVDGDGYTSSEDCNDEDPLVNPGVSEICADGIDNNCDTQIDEGCGGTTGDHADLTWVEYPSACLSCHSAEAGDMFGAVHYQWVGPTPDMTNQPGTPQGKLTNSVNSYCINIEGDWKICGKCHVGRGLRPDDPAAGQENIDCLVCHSFDYSMARTRLADGTMGPPDGIPQATLDSYVQNIQVPERGMCLKCHAYAGGANAVKRGDLSKSDADLAMGSDNNNVADFDVHMNVLGPDLACQACHIFVNHKVTGKGSDLRPTDFASEVKCSTATCHPGMDASDGHSLAGANRTDADRHVAHVSCQACHIDVYAKVATETHRDWRSHHDGSPADGVSGPGHPHTEKGDNLVPEYLFWNRLSDNYLLGDDAALTYDAAKGTYPTSRPLGDLNDGKLYPFKYKTADQPMTSADKRLIALDTLEYLGISGDAVKATESGLVNMGYPANEPYEWVVTDTYQLLNHGIAPAANVNCAKCHESNFDVAYDTKLDKLGYKLKDAKALICSQCHGEKNLPRDHERMHDHINKGSGIDCLFCHDFSRPERGLVGPCDPGASEFVDTNPYPHTCN